MSLIASRKFNGVEPLAHMGDILIKLAHKPSTSELELLLPDR